MSGLFKTKASSLPTAAPALSLQQSSYGVPVNLIYGTNRVSGNLIWYSDFQQVLTSTGGGSGKGGIAGGGGKGGGSQQYNYFASFMIGICQGQINGIGQVWASKQTYVNLSQLGAVLFNGALNQAPWGYLTTNHPTQADGYNTLAYAAFANYALGTSAETPQFSFEVNGLLYGAAGTQDAFADQVFTDFMARANFPSVYVGDFTNFANYVNSMGFFISPVIDQQRQAIDWMKEWMDTLNSEFVWNGTLSAVPYGDVAVSGNGYSYTPNLTPIYNITDDDLLVNGDEDPVEIDRADLPDAYNRLPIEYINRADQYNVETFIAEDQGAIQQYGVRVGSTLRAHHITDPNVAQQMIYLRLWRSIYIDKGNQFTLKLPWNYILLDPMDLIAVTTGTLLDNKLIRIKKISEDEDGTLNFTCEDMPGQIALPALYSTQGVNRYIPNYNSSPGNVNVPVIFESPLALVQTSAVELDLAVSGQGSNWGGCQVWVSTDGVTYQNTGLINGAARMGLTTSAITTFTPSTSNPIDLTNTLGVDMTESEGSFNNAATNADAQSNNTLCYVDGELISFGKDQLTAEFKYNLSYLNRGAYGSTIGAHASGTNFVRFDAAVVRYGLDQSRVGQTLYFKFLSFNVFGGGLQQLQDVSPYTYNVTGAALLTPLANPANLSVSYVDNIARLSWTPISDIRYPILYEIRKGATFDSSQILDTTAQSSFLVFGTDTYWVTALYFTPFNVPVYSSSPPSISVVEPSITQYVLGDTNEDPAWTGTLGGGAVIVGSVVELQFDNNILELGNVLPVPDLLTYGSVAASGSYTIPTGHIIKSNSISPAKVIMNWTLSAVSVTSDVTAIGDVVTTPDITGIVSSSLVRAVPQIQVSQDGGTTYGAWQNWVPGVYPGNAWNFQILIYTLDPTVIAVLSTFSYDVDVPLAVQTGTGTTSSSTTTTISFADEFNINPAITITNTNQQAGDDPPLLGTVTTSGFQVDVYNGGSRVVRNISYTATGY